MQALTDLISEADRCSTYSTYRANLGKITLFDTVAENEGPQDHRRADGWSGIQGPLTTQGEKRQTGRIGKIALAPWREST